MLMNHSMIVVDLEINTFKTKIITNEEESPSTANNSMNLKRPVTIGTLRGET